MGLIKGIDVILIDKVKIKTNDFGEDIFEDKEILVKNVIISPASSDDVLNALNLTAKKAIYTLGIPKGDQNNWEDKEVIFFNRKWRTFGAVLQGIESLIPLDWNKKVMVEYYG